MRTRTYVKRDYAFGQAMLRLRTAIRLTQMELAQRLGVCASCLQLSWLSSIPSGPLAFL